tara:strand:+ start:1644 stop:2210 length:567 start_codon:yes stop_codon:yes gene_type:complete
MSDHKFIKNYLEDFAQLIQPNKELVENLIMARDLILKTSLKKNKVLIFGNGGSASIASHVSVDLTKNAKIKCLNFNEASLITCFSNDYGFHHWTEKAIDFYGNDGDMLIVISSSGKSVNMLNAVKAARNRNFSSVITLSGFSENNPLSKLGNLNLWVDSNEYNFVENIHQIWLLMIVDLLIGKRDYSA